MKSSTSNSLSTSLLCGLQNGDSEAWSRFVRIFTPLVYSWCRRSHLASHDCLDIVQDVFQSVHTAIPRFQPHQTQGSFRGWLATITRNKIIDFQRRGSAYPIGVGGSEFLQTIASVPQSAEAVVLGREEGLAATWSSAPITSSDDSITNSQHQATIDSSIFENTNDRHQLVRRAAQQIRSEFEPKTWEMFWQTAVEGKYPLDVAALHNVQVTAVYKAKSRVLKRLRTVLAGMLDS